MTILSVTQINQYIKSVIDYDNNLKQVFITGEISNYKPHYSGHHYMTLKDESSEIKAVMFASSAQRLKFSLENGMKVIVRGRISVYDAKGQYQLYCEDIQPDGIGALTIAYEQLKNKLEKAGWFSQDIKKTIPQFSTKIGVVTASTGAAVKDIFSILERRFPCAEIVFVPVAVQGVYASSEISSAIKLLDETGECDVIIAGRGGGSIEDLWAFNEEIVAKAIFECNTPVISAVGHETDFTIADYVADLRAPTPSAAAELCTPNTDDMLYTLDTFVDSSKEKIDYLISKNELELHSINEKISRHNAPLLIEERCNYLNSIFDNIQKIIETKFFQTENKLSNLLSKIESNSPLNILSKGYAIVKDSNGNVIKSVNNISQGDDVQIKLCDGTLNCRVL